jgi:rod shape-determining protein MreC
MTVVVQRKPFLGLILLVVCNFFLISVQVRSEQGEVLLRSWGLTLFTPPVQAVRYLADRIVEIGDHYLLLVGVEERNRFLEQENARLQLQLHQYEGLKGMVERSRRFDFLRGLYEFETLRARVIWHSFPDYSHRILINVGGTHSVRKDNAVITPDGVVGRVFTTTLINAEVELLTDMNAAAGAVLLDSRLQGVLQGTGEQFLVLNFIPSTEEVTAGETVVTSGSDRIYPKGLPLGEVVSSEKDGVYQRILVRPLADFARLEEVAVVIAER